MLRGIKKYISERLGTYSFTLTEFDDEFKGVRPENAPELGLISEFKSAISDLLREHFKLSPDVTEDLVKRYNDYINNSYYEGLYPSNVSKNIVDEYNKSSEVKTYSAEVTLNPSSPKYKSYKAVADLIESEYESGYIDECLNGIILALAEGCSKLVDEFKKAGDEYKDEVEGYTNDKKALLDIIKSKGIDVRNMFRE